MSFSNWPFIKPLIAAFEDRHPTDARRPDLSSASYEFMLDELIKAELAIIRRDR